MAIAALLILALVVLGALAGDPVWAFAMKFRGRRRDRRVDVAREPQPLPRAPVLARGPARTAHHRPAHSRVRSERRPEFVKHH
jgi:hypothetical protein